MDEVNRKTKKQKNPHVVTESRMCAAFRPLALQEVAVFFHCSPTTNTFQCSAVYLFILNLSSVRRTKGNSVNIAAS